MQRKSAVAATVATAVVLLFRNCLRSPRSIVGRLRHPHHHARLLLTRAAAQAGAPCWIEPER